MSVEDDCRSLSDRLDATAELPVRPAASTRLGEAAAIAADVADADLPESVVVERVDHVRRLLEAVESTGSAAADEHVRAATRLARQIVEAHGAESVD
jgi:hypothetical protein